MDQKRSALAAASVALAFIVVGCFAAQLYLQQNFNYTCQAEDNHAIEVSSAASLKAITINRYILLGATPQLSVQTTTPSQSYLANVTRSQMYSYINQNPGIQFRAITSALCLPVGLVEYHLGVLVKAGLVSFVRDGRYKRFFVSNRFGKGETALICLLRHKTAKRIFEVLLHKKELSHCRLAEEVAISSQALTWQMKTLRNTKYLLRVNHGTKTLYSLKEAQTANLTRTLALVEQ